jgi:Reverse transcriptase (RNA-dependent DNA polymerase)
VYVDDIIVTGSNRDQVQTYITLLGWQFAIRDMDNLHYFLGVEATTTSNGLCLTQTKYLFDLLKRTNMLNSKSCSSPIAYGTFLSQGGSSPYEDSHLYRSVVSAFQYATLTVLNLLSPSTKFLSSCTNQLKLIEQQSNISFGTSLVHFIIGYNFIATLPPRFMPMATLIGLAILMIDVLPRVTVYMLEEISSHGVPRNNRRFLVQAQRMNIAA